MEIRLIAMSRSGGHALANWILAQAAGRTCFLNCTEPGQNPFLSARPMDDGAVHRANYPEFDLARERRGELTRKDLLLYSHEDCFLGYLQKDDRAGHHDEWVGPSTRRLDVLLVRDPFNLFASRTRATGIAGHPTALRVWKQHAREFLGERRLLRADRVLVSYNAWVTGREYRRQVAEALGLPFSDAGRDHVPAAGGGSSFDGRRFDGRADRMAVLERWRWLETLPAATLAALFDHDTIELSTRIFGRVCTEGFLDRLRYPN